MPEADPSAAAPEGIKPEWYFLSQFQLLKLFPGKLEMVGILLLAALPMGLIVLPFIDRAVPMDGRGRVVRGIGVLALLGLVFFTVWGWLS
jgi:cytochrome b6